MHSSVFWYFNDHHLRFFAVLCIKIMNFHQVILYDLQLFSRNEWADTYTRDRDKLIAGFVHCMRFIDDPPTRFVFSWQKIPAIKFHSAIFSPLFLNMLCDSIFFSSYLFRHLSISLPLLLPLLSISAYIKMVWRPGCVGRRVEEGPRHFMNFHSLRSFQVRQPRRAPQSAQCVRVEHYLWSHPRRIITSLRPLLFKHYGPSGTITRTFWSNGCCFVSSV